jgi:hypothetical protein
MPLLSMLSVAVALILCMEPCHAQEGAAGTALLATYRSALPEIEASPFGVPLLLHSEGRDSRTRGEVLGIIDQPYPLVAHLLEQPCSWCDIALLHLNTKACTWSSSGEQDLVTLFTGRKHYQAPQEAQQIQYLFSSSRLPEFLKVSLTAEQGPLGTNDYQIIAEAVPLEGERTFLRFQYAYSHGLRARLAMQAYLTTLGRGKEGLSTEGRDEQGNPVRTKGFRGVIERNALRYFYAIQAVLDALRLPDDRRMIDAAGTWFELTERHPQLHEIPREEYLAHKTREIEASRLLQGQIGVFDPQQK